MKKGLISILCQFLTSVKYCFFLLLIILQLILFSIFHQSFLTSSSSSSTEIKTNPLKQSERKIYLLNMSSSLDEACKERFQIDPVYQYKQWEYSKQIPSESLKVLVEPSHWKLSASNSNSLKPLKLFLVIESGPIQTSKELRESMRQIMFKLTLESKNIEWSYFFLIGNPSKTELNVLKTEYSIHKDLLILTNSYQDNLIINGFSWLLNQNISFQTLIKIDEMSYLNLEKALLEFRYPFLSRFYMNCTRLIERYNYTYMESIFSSQFSNSSSLVFTNEPFIIERDIVLKLVQTYNRKVSIPLFLCEKFQLDLNQRHIRQGCHYRNNTLIFTLCDEFSMECIYHGWTKQRNKFLARATDPPQEPCYRGNEFDVIPEPFFPFQYKMNYQCQLPKCEKNFGKFERYVQNYLRRDFPYTWALLDEETFVYQPKASLHNRNPKGYRAQSDYILKHYFNGNSKLLNQTEVIRYVFIDNTTTNYHWLEMKIANEYVVGEVMEKNGVWCCHYREFPIKDHPTRIVFLLSASHQEEWLFCLFENVKFFSSVLSSKGISIMFSMVYYYEDENLSYLNKIFEKFENLPFPHYMILVNDKFSRGGGLWGAASIPEIQENDILITGDLHVDYPLEFILDALKFTTKDQQIYNPVVMRLEQNLTIDEWYYENLVNVSDGFGIISVYAHDFRNIPIDPRYLTRTLRGAEDWDYANNCGIYGIRFVRPYPDRYVHYWHSRNPGTGWYNEDEDATTGKKKKRAKRRKPSPSQFTRREQSPNIIIISFVLLAVLLILCGGTMCFIIFTN